MLLLIGIVLLFGGIGYTFESILAGTIRMVIPYKKSLTGKKHHYCRNGILCTFAGIGLILLAI